MSEMNVLVNFVGRGIVLGALYGATSNIGRSTISVVDRITYHQLLNGLRDSYIRGEFPLRPSLGHIRAGAIAGGAIGAVSFLVALAAHRIFN